MTLDPAELGSAVRDGDAIRVRDLLAAATEADRRAAAKALAGLFKGPELPKEMDFFSPERRAYSSWREISNRPAFVAAAVGVAGGIGVAFKALNDFPFPYFSDSSTEVYDAVTAVLVDRNPPWLGDLVERRLVRAPGGVPAWPLARRLVRRGAINRPDIAEYTTLMPHWVGDDTGQQRSLLGALCADPGLLEDEVWRIFTVPGTEPALRSAFFPDRPDSPERESAWSCALATLADVGELDRGRLLDACLDAFVRDFPANQVRWYLEFHDKMAPRPDEMAARADKYLALLAAPSTVAVALGQRACGALLDGGPGRLDVSAFLAASPPAFGFPQKWVALNQLKLLGKLAARDESARPQALTVAAEAFTHPREDVQQAALKLIAKHGIPADPAARAAISALAASLSAIVAPDAFALGITAPPATATIAEPSIVYVASCPSPPKPEPVAPVTDPAELIQLLAQLIEDASDAVAVERAVAGAVRLACLPLADRARMAGPLMKRAEQVARLDWMGFTGGAISAHLSWLVHAWATGKRPSIRPQERAWLQVHPHWVSDSREALMMSGIITARVFEACELVASGRTATLLAEPEFADGAIGHRALLDRLSPAADAPYRRHDVGVALLRLEPGAPDSFWAEWGRIDASMAAQAHRAYLASTAELNFETYADGPNMPYVSASLATAVPAHQLPVSFPGNGSVDHCWRLLINELANQTQTDIASRARAEYGRPVIEAIVTQRDRTDEVVAAWPLLAPHHPELIAAHLLHPLSDGLEAGRSAATTALTSLAQPGHEFGPIGHLALVTAMASAEPDTRIAAASTWARTAQDGRLTPNLAADAITQGVKGNAFKLNRLAESLSYAATNPVAASSVARAAMLATAALLPAKPTNLHLLLEESARAAAAGLAQSAITPAAGSGPTATAIPPAIAALAASTARTKLAEAARLLTRVS
jgi:hypothetical protein